MILKIDDRIRNRQVQFFNDFTLSLRYDSIASAFSFGFYFNPENIDLKEMACMGHFHKCTVEHNGELLLTGFILNEAFSSGPEQELVAFNGYSLPGVLEDCQIPVSIYPLQSDMLSLREIAEKLIKPFGLKMVIDPAVSKQMEKIFETTSAKESQSVKSYLTELAAQKNIILSHNAKGQLLFTKAKTKQDPIIEFGFGPIATKMSLSFNGQAMHSDITVLKQADVDGGNAGQYTIKNPYVPYVFRPRVITQTSGDDIDTEQAAKNALAEELKEIKLTIVTDRWDINGKLIKPNNIITVINPDLYLYKKTKWFIEQVDFGGNHESMTATLTCVLPEVYNGEIPEYIFKGINLH